jgi:hypothetical protein
MRVVPPTRITSLMRSRLTCAIDSASFVYGTRVRAWRTASDDAVCPMSRLNA